jgi:hypothetical protein
MAKRIIKHWYYHPAEWWQFWYPQSGLPGALLFWALFYAVGFWSLVLKCA